MKPALLLWIVPAALMMLAAVSLFAQSRKPPVQPGNDSLAYNPYYRYPVYDGDDLGVRYTPAKTILKVWSPPAEAMQLRLYTQATGGEPSREIDCKKSSSGVWTAELKGDQKGLYYTFRAKINGKWNGEYPDPYARAVGTNGLRGQIIDLRETDPPGWAQDRSPALKSPTDAVIYELHVRDLSIHPNSGIRNKGKFIGLTETGTVNSLGQKTGLDHMAELGVTHVHLLPVFDFQTVDESKPEVPQFNWGYDPQNFNVPEGSYSTDPADGRTRIREFKQMVQALHRKGIRVIMDVVYNHTSRTHDSGFDQLVPGYYYRQWEKDKSYSNGSGCGNETASDRAMVRKFIVESVVYWVKEYHVDGFRFDLMALHDRETMKQVSAAVHAIDPSILVYGEGWTAGDSPLPVKYRALKDSVSTIPGIAVFSDDIRDAVKGSVFDEHSTGFASGSKTTAETVRFGIAGAIDHPQIDFSKTNYSKAPYAADPLQAINYVACHDNHTLYDKLKVSRPDASEEDRIRMHTLANTIVFTSQGIPFLHAGEEMMRTKGGEHNSYNKPDSVNRIDWEWKHSNRELYDYYRKLIALRQAHPAFRMPSADGVKTHLVFLTIDDPQLIAFQLNDHANGDPWEQITVFFNGSAEAKSFPLPHGEWKVALKDGRFGDGSEILRMEATLEPISAMILYRE